MENYYAALNYTETLDNDKNHIIVKIQLHGDKRVSHYQHHHRLNSNTRLDRQRSLQQTRDQDDQSKQPKGDLRGGRKTNRYGSCYPYDESTYGH